MPFRLANVDGRAALVDGDNYFDLEKVSEGQLDSDPMAAIARFEELGRIDLVGAAADGTLADVTLGAPVPRPRQVFAIGVNYRDHAAEADMTLPDYPMVFTKWPSSIHTPTGDIMMRGDSVDWEVELVVVIGKTTKDVSQAYAWNHVAGITVGQDISDRVVQLAVKPLPQMSLGKSFDTFSPIGPVLVSKDGVKDVDDLRITCDVSGERKQDSRTKHMIFNVPQQIEYISSILTMHPGDVIFTGTPDGVGYATGTYLKEGDVVVSEIEGIGTMKNRCIQER